MTTTTTDTLGTCTKVKALRRRSLRERIPSARLIVDLLRRVRFRVARGVGEWRRRFALRRGDVFWTLHASVPPNLLSRLLHALLEHLARAFLGAHLLRRLLGVELLGLVVPDSRKRGVERVSPNDRAAGFDGRDAWETAGRVPRADEAADRGAGSTYAQMLPTKKTSTSVEMMPMIRYAGFDSESAMASGTHEARSKD